MGHRHAITSKRILLPSGIQSGHLIINDHLIEEVLPEGQLSAGIPQTDVGNRVVMPGVIDPHVHINEPGRTHWEGFTTATQAAAAGGTTTLVDMPLNSTPVTIDRRSFQQKLAAATEKTFVNCGFWGGFVPGSEAGLKELMSEGVLGIKVFMTDSGLDDFQAVTKKDLLEAMTIMSDYRLPLLAHAEMAAPLPYPDPFHNNVSSYLAHVDSRPPSWELNAIESLIELCEQTQTPTHVVHLAASEALDMLRQARSNLPITVETCPHYLYFASEKIPDGKPEYKCTPPIRDADNNLKLWQALTAGDIDFVATDHSPAPPELKHLDSGNLQEAWGGISSIQFLLPVTWTLCRKHGQSLDFLKKILCENAASFIGQTNKGRILPGFDADLVVWDPEDSFMVKAEDFFYKHKISPYLGEKLFGVVYQTYVNGQLVYDQGSCSSTPSGKILIRQ